MNEIISDFCTAGNPEISFSSGTCPEFLSQDDGDVDNIKCHINGDDDIDADNGDVHNINDHVNGDDDVEDAIDENDVDVDVKMNINNSDEFAELENCPEGSDVTNIDLFLFEPELVQEQEPFDLKPEETSGNEMFENFEIPPKARSADPIYSGRCYCFLTSLSDRRGDNDDDVNTDAKELNVARSLDRLSAMTTRPRMEQPSVSPSPTSG